MNNKPKVLLSWSGGKDSSLTLYEIQKQGVLEIDSLVTTVTADYDRVSMHGLRNTLLHEQVKSLNLPLEKVVISKGATNQEYEQSWTKSLSKYKEKGIDTVAFGDLYLEDIRQYRIDQLSKIGMKCIFPIWKKDTSKLARSFVKWGFKAITVCVDSKVLSKEFVGREYDNQFLDQLPKEIDPCGENGEFHTFVYDGPIFNKVIPHTLGEIVLRDERFYYCDIMPGG
ncbi:MAG: diphthine--ammonia ligase [Thermodesulfobacteriota bacterium]